MQKTGGSILAGCFSIAEIMSIAEKLLRISTAKANIKAAIIAKGVSDVGDVLEDYAGKIGEISGSDPVLSPLVVNANGFYTPPQGQDGYNTVSVNVPTFPGGFYRLRLFAPALLSKTGHPGLSLINEWRLEEGEAIDFLLNTYARNNATEIIQIIGGYDFGATSFPISIFDSNNVLSVKVEGDATEMPAHDVDAFIIPRELNGASDLIFLNYTGEYTLPLFLNKGGDCYLYETGQTITVSGSSKRLNIPGPYTGWVGCPAGSFNRDLSGSYLDSILAIITSDLSGDIINAHSYTSASSLKYAVCRSFLPSTTVSAIIMVDPQNGSLIANNSSVTAAASNRDFSEIGFYPIIVKNGGNRIKLTYSSLEPVTGYHLLDRIIN